MGALWNAGISPQKPFSRLKTHIFYAPTKNIFWVPPIICQVYGQYFLMYLVNFLLKLLICQFIIDNLLK